jgi:hypothetical protein
VEWAEWHAGSIRSGQESSRRVPGLSISGLTWASASRTLHPALHSESRVRAAPAGRLRTHADLLLTLLMGNQIGSGPSPAPKAPAALVPSAPPSTAPTAQRPSLGA